MKWQVEIGGRLSQPVVAGEKILVAAVDDHAVIALDRRTGKIAWTYIAGGRVDSPPTLYRGLALFGCADGYVYCLRASDGELAWRFRAAPYDRRIVAREQLESAWPAHGSVLIRQGVLYVVAGRSTFLDGGLTLYRLNPLNGQMLSRVQMDENDPNTGKNLHSHIKVLSMPVASPDILSCDGKNIYMRSQPLDAEGKRNRVAQIGLDKQRGEDAHLFAPNGFLDDDWWHRSFWVYGRAVLGGPGYAATGKSAPSGKIMVLDDKNVYVFGRRAKYWRWTTPMEYRLFAVDRRLPRPGKPAATGGRRARARGRSGLQYAELWSVELPVLVRAMVKAGDTIFAAGPADVADEEEATRLTRTTEAIPPQLRKQERLFAGDAGSVLWAVSAKDGRKKAEIKLDVLPVFDGLIAAGGELYMATVDGKVACLRGAAR
jgi:outer membrane protein assembly factor BamB